MACFPIQKLTKISRFLTRITPTPSVRNLQVSGNGIPSGHDGRYYLYSASGVKLQEKEIMPPVLLNHPDNRARTDYVGNLIYDRTSLKKVLFPGGYAEASGTGWVYRFFVTDHLGNVRLVTDASGTILQTNHYDPYGESLPAGAAADSGNPYKWGGKEYVSEQDSYDFGARYYTTSIPRWTTMDPLCEKYYSISPYAYCAGNPVNLVDPDGMVFTERAMAIIESFEEDINNRKEIAQSRLDALNQKKLERESSGKKVGFILKMQISEQERVIEELYSAQKEVQDLKESEQLYDIIIQNPITLSNNDYGYTRYIQDTGAITAFILNRGTRQFKATIAHELKHMYQFETGELGFFTIKNGDLTLSLYDYNDEVEAHNRGTAFGGRSIDDERYKILSKKHINVNNTIIRDYVEYSNNNAVVFRYNGVTYVPQKTNQQ